MRYSRRSVLGASLAFSFDFAARAASAAQFEFKCATDLPTDHPVTVWQYQMWKAIERESNGRISCQIFPNGVLGSDASMITQMRTGALPFLLTNAGPLSAIVPTSSISAMGFAFKNSADGLRVMDGELGEYIRRESATKGFYCFRRMWEAGMQSVTTSARPIRTPEDLRGLKVRVSNTRILVDLFRTLGANPTPLDVAEVYTALQTKLIDGEGGGLAAVETLRWFEVQKYLSITNHSFGAFWFMANADLWKSLPQDVQGIIERNNEKHALLERRDFAALDNALANKLARQGIAVNRVDQAPFRARLRPYYESWANTFGTTAWALLEAGVGKLT